MKRQWNLNHLWRLAAWTLVAMACLLPTAAWAQEAGTLHSEGTCGADGDNLTWKLTYTGETYTSSGEEKPKLKLTISGTGDMADYKYVSGSGYSTPWYSVRTSIYEADLQEGMTNIGAYALPNVPADTLTIPSTVQTIKNNAFYNCYRLRYLMIPAGVTSIGSNSFVWCGSLRGIMVSPLNPVYDSRNDCYAIIETATNTLVKGAANSVIPDGVQTIGFNAFSNISMLTSINIPNSVTTIEGGAFNECGLTSLHIPAGVTSIQPSAFYRCMYLNTITVDEDNPVYDSRNNCNALIETASNTLMKGSNRARIPVGITSIGDGAFFGLRELTSINIPSTVRTINAGAFNECPNLKDVNCYALPTNVMIINPNYQFSSNPTFHVAPGSAESWQSAWSQLPVTFVDDLEGGEDEGGTESAIVSTFSGFESHSYEVVTVGTLNSKEGKKWIFSHSGPNHYQAYGDMTTMNGQECLVFGFADYPVVTIRPDFQLSGKLSKVIFKIGGDLKNVTVRPSENGDARGLGFSTPFGAITEFEVDYSNNPVEVDPNNFSIMFENFSNNINQPLFIQSITLVMLTEGGGSGNGGSCGPNLKWQLTDTGNTVEVYKDGSWVDVPAKKLTISGTGEMYNYQYSADYGEVAPWSDYNKAIAEVVIAEGVTSIGQFALRGVGSSESILTIPATVTSIGGGAFDSSNFEDVYCYANPDNLTWDAKYSFYERVGVHVFEADEAKWRAKYPDARFIFFFDLAQPGELPGGKCGNNARWQLVSLGRTHQIWWGGKDQPDVFQSRKVVITGTGSMTNFASRDYVPWMRQNRYNIVEVEIADGITNIGDYAFAGALKLTKATFTGSVKTIGVEAFYNCDYQSDFVIPDGVQTIGERAFCASSFLHSVTVPASVTNVGAGALAAYRIETIVVDPANPVYTSRDDAGNECNILLEKATGLLVAATVKSVLPATVKAIGARCYENSEMKEMTIPASVESIGKNAFYYCPELVALTIGSGVKSIDQDAFQSTSNLLDVYCYANPSTLAWAEKSSQYVREFKNDKMTQFHVFAADLETWKTNFSWVNVTFVGDLEEPIKPVIKEKEIAFDGLKGVDLTEPVTQNDVYYNLGTGGTYKDELGCIVLNKPTDMSAIKNSTPGSSDIREKFSGIIVKVGAGRGKITLNMYTKGNASLMVRIGNGTPAAAVRDSRGDVIFTYNVSADTYVYIYSVNNGAAARGEAPDEEDAVMIYGITVTPETGSVEGDLNGDGGVDVGDIMAIINFMAGQPGNVRKEDADLNGDGGVDVGDIMAIINIMAGPKE